MTGLSAWLIQYSMQWLKRGGYSNEAGGRSNLINYGYGEDVTAQKA